MIENQSNTITGFILAIIFLFVQLLFQINAFTPAFVTLLLSIIGAVFLSEQYRVFIWTTFCFFVGLFAILYGDRLLLEFTFSHDEGLILSRLFLLIPIVLMVYVIKKFKEPVIAYRKVPDWNKDLFFPFIWWGFTKISVKKFFFLILGLLLIFLFFLGISDSLTNWPRLRNIIVYAFINGILSEVVWRGILLTRLVRLVGYQFAVVVTSFSSSLFYYLFGLSLMYCFLYFIAGLFFGGLTLKSNSLIPAVSLHCLITFIMGFTGIIPLVSQ